MRVVFFGTPDFAVAPLRKLLSTGHEVLAAVTQPDRRSGRGRHINYCPVKIEAQRAGLRIYQPQRVGDVDFIHELQDMNPSGIVVAAYGQILPSAIIHLPKYGCVNIHASLLPKYRGAAPINWALIHGEKKTGVTTMLMDEGMDTGPILLMDETEITEDDTAGSLSQRLADMGSDLVVQTLRGLEKGSIIPQPQRGDASYAPLLKKTDGFIRWLKSAEEVSNFIRGMNPWPGAYGLVEGKRYKILKATPFNRSCEAGVIDQITKDNLIVGTGKGAVSIREIQPPGKPPMTIQAFLQGRKLRQGMRFDPAI